MAIRLPIPLSDTKPIITANQFTATFNVPTVGRYDFDVTANQSVKLIDLNATGLFVIERISYGLNMPAEAYNESIVTIPNVQFLTQKTQKPVLPNTQPFVVYFNNFETVMFVQTKQDQDELLITFRGQLQQVAATAGWPTVTANLSMNIYEIKNKDWIDLFYQYNPIVAKKLMNEGIALI